ncbi:DUF3800 domain-containing protein [Allokutzneria sp. NRRL B-24872]|uniref:DUF3800 domain-containing protein n=1 Tax=Allokutzneria sp. NRRL B-24872 TaxID=1137961 RepID=UPI00143D5EEA|nr:DUF3800 domain-containing protein [Allokutzneria sp. NRRL B-24872]
MRLVHVDDSGTVDRQLAPGGLMLFSFLAICPTTWYHVRWPWLAFRRTLDATIGLPSGYELHGVKFLGGRGRPRGRNNPDIPRDERLRLFKLALDTIAALPGLELTSLAVRTTDRELAYDRCLRHRLLSTGPSTPHVIVVDGDGTDPTYRRVHRSIQEGRDGLPALIEDPMFQPSAAHQMIQMADLVAYAAFQQLVANPRYPERHTLYSDHLWRLDQKGPIVLEK